MHSMTDDNDDDDCETETNAALPMEIDSNPFHTHNFACTAAHELRLSYLLRYFDPPFLLTKCFSWIQLQIAFQTINDALSTSTFVRTSYTNCKKKIQIASSATMTTTRGSNRVNSEMDEMPFDCVAVLNCTKTTCSRHSWYCICITHKRSNLYTRKLVPIQKCNVHTTGTCVHGPTLSMCVRPVFSCICICVDSLLCEKIALHIYASAKQPNRRLPKKKKTNGKTSSENR